MQRRAYLAGAIGIVGSLAGCSGILGDSEDSASDDARGPAETVESFYETALNGDAEAVRSHVHPAAEMPAPSDQAVENVQRSSLQLEGTTVIEQGEDEATVEATVSQETMSGEREERTVRFLLRPSNGEWNLYDQPLAGSDAPVAPQVQWEMRSSAEDGAVTAVEFTHSGGDTIDAPTLSARADGATAAPAGEETDVTAGTIVVVPLEGDGEPLSTGTEVQLLWTDPESDDDATLTSFTLNQDAAGSLGDRVRIGP